MPKGKSTLIESTVSVGGYPGSADGSTAAKPGRAAQLRVDARQEFVASSTYQTMANYLRSLSWSIDDLAAAFGDEIYDRMQRDPQVKGAGRLVKMGILSDGVETTPAVDDESEPEFALAKEIQETLDRNLRNLDTPLEDVLWNLTDALFYGNKVAEQVYDEPRIVQGKTRLLLKALKVKPRHSTAFVIDVFDNVVGLLARIPGIGLTVQQGALLYDPAHAPNLLPRDKFAILTYQPVDSDPRGTSILRCVYTPWNAKQQLYGSYIKYLALFAIPWIIANTPPDAEPPRDANGNPVLNADGTPQSTQQAMLAGLVNLANGGIAVLPPGAVAALEQPTGNGEMFIKAFELLNAEIAFGIMSQTLATGQGAHASRAQASVHQDALELVIRDGKHAVARMIRRDILMPLVRYNWGEQYLHLTPGVSLGQVQEKDIAPALTALATTPGWRVFASQLPGLYEMFGLPAASTEDLVEAQQTPTESPIPQTYNTETGAGVSAPNRPYLAPKRDALPVSKGRGTSDQLAAD